MYTSDSLFCKSVLSIPVPSSSESIEVPSVMEDDSGRVTKSSTFQDPDEIEVIVEDPSTSSFHSNSSASSKKKTKRVNNHNNFVAKSKKSQQQYNNQEEEEDSYHQGMSRSQSEFLSWTHVTSPVGPSDSISISSDPSSISLSTLNGSRNSSVRTSRTSIRKTEAENSVKVKEETASDFLSRIDSSIQRTKEQVAKNQETLVPYHSSHSDNDLFSLEAGSSSRADNGWKKTYVSLDVPSNGTSSPSNHEVPACYIKAKEHKVRYSMRRLEQQQDELFQL